MKVSLSKKALKTPRQKLFSVLMKELAGAKGDELANLLVEGDHDRFKEDFAASVANMVKRFKLTK